MSASERRGASAQRHIRALLVAKMAFQTELKESLKRLLLPAFVAHATQSVVAANEGWTYDQYLLRLCELEIAQRETQAAEADGGLTVAA